MSEKRTLPLAVVSSSKSKSSTKAWTLELTADTIVNAGVRNAIYKYSRITNVTNEIHWKSEDIWNSDGSCTLKIGGSNIETTKAHKTWVTNSRGGLQGYFQSETVNAGVPTGTIQLNFSSTNSRKFEIDSWKLTYEYYLPVFVVSLSAGTGGTVSGAGTYDVGTNATIKATPNSGYKFVKWSDGNTNASRTVTVANGSQTAFSTSLNYSAIFEKEMIPCTITYDGNGATVIPFETQSGYAETPLTLPTCNSDPLAATDFYKLYVVGLWHRDKETLAESTIECLYSMANFLGWYTAAEGGYRVGGSGDSYTPTGDITLYAHWGEMSVVTLPAVTKEGYTFSGWYSDETGGERIGGANDLYTPVENGVILYAHWEATDIYIGSTIVDVYIGSIKAQVYQGTQKIYG